MRWSCRTSTPTTTRSTSSAPPRACCSTVRPDAQDDDRQGGGQQPGREGLEGARRKGHRVLPQREGPGAAEQVCRRDRAKDPRGLSEGQGKGGRRRARGDLLRRG